MRALGLAGYECNYRSGGGVLGGRIHQDESRRGLPAGREELQLALLAISYDRGDVCGTSFRDDHVKGIRASLDRDLLYTSTYSLPRERDRPVRRTRRDVSRVASA